MNRAISCHPLWPLGLLLFVTSLQATGQVRTELEIEPNAIQDPAKPMIIRVTGVPNGETVHFQILQDCDGDDQPDLKGTATCISPLHEWDSNSVDGQSVSDQLDFKKLRHTLPEDRPLWLRASWNGSSQALLALFRLDSPCVIWKSLLDTFKRGPCRPGHLLQALLKSRGATTWKNPGRFEVRRLDFGKKPAQPMPVLGTHGATGLNWLNDKTLLVTIAPAAGPSQLLRVPLPGGDAKILWKGAAGDARIATAPLSLDSSRNRIAFVRQVQGTSSALLSVLEDKNVDPKQDFELPYSIHQLVAADSKGNEILALTLGVENSQPAFLRINLAARTVENVGFDPRLYWEIFRSPQENVAIVAFVDVSGQKGWDLQLVDESGEPKNRQNRLEDDLMPTWRPSGGEVAFLAEIGIKEKKP